MALKMDAEEFLARARDPRSWVVKSVGLYRSGRALRKLGDMMWEGAIEMPEGDDQQKQAKKLALGNAATHLRSSIFLYGLALESAVKAYLILRHPEKVQITVTTDGLGEVRDAELARIGVPLSKGHDLESLCDEMKLFRRGEHAILPSPDTHDDVRDVLQLLSHIVIWAGRYPVPRIFELHSVKDSHGSRPLQEIESWVTYLLEYIIRDSGGNPSSLYE